MIDSVARVLLGDRQRLVEERNDTWPLQRDDEIIDEIWALANEGRIAALRY